MALLVFVCATTFAWVCFLLIKNSESDTTTETRPEPNPESCNNQVPTTEVQEATSRNHITPLPVMWEPEQASAVLPDSTDSMDKNTEKLPVDHFPGTTTKISEEYVKNLENDNQNLKNEIGACQNRLHNVSAMHGVDEIVEEKERLQDEVKFLKVSVAKYESDSRNQEKLDSDELTQLRYENSKLKTNLELSDRTVSFQSDEIKNLMDTTNDLNNKLKETLLQYDELMDKDVASKAKVAQLKKELTAFESQIDELKKEKSVLLCNASTWEITEKLLRNEIVHLKYTIGTKNEILSLKMCDLERERIKNEDSFICKGMLAIKERENKELKSRNFDLESDKSLLELNNDNLKKEAEDCREELERLKQENQKLLDTQEETLSSV